MNQGAKVVKNKVFFCFYIALQVKKNPTITNKNPYPKLNISVQKINKSILSEKFSKVYNFTTL